MQVIKLAPACKYNQAKLIALLAAKARNNKVHIVVLIIQ
jgi:hypothetical protein